MIRLGLEWFQTKSATFLALFALAAVIMGGPVWIATLQFQQDTKRFLLYEESKTNYTLFTINQQRGVVSELDVEVPENDGWKTYRNEEFGFEFQYPASWKVIRESELKRDIGGADGLVTIDKHLKPMSQSATQWIAATNKIADPPRNNVETVVVSGKAIVTATSYNEGGAVKHFHIDFGEYILAVSYQNYEEESRSIYSDIFASIAFTDGSSEWKTYRNEEFGFQFQYPPEFMTILDLQDNKIADFEYEFDEPTNFRLFVLEHPLFDFSFTDNTGGTYTFNPVSRSWTVSATASHLQDGEGKERLEKWKPSKIDSTNEIYKYSGSSGLGVWDSYYIPIRNQDILFEVFYGYGGHPPTASANDVYKLASDRIIDSFAFIE